MTTKTSLIVNQSAPYGSATSQESLELAMALSNFGTEVKLLFVDDGVFQLKTQQTPAKIDTKAFVKSFPALEFYDIEDIYVCQHSLIARQLTAEDLIMPVSLVLPEQIKQLLAGNHQVMVF